MQEEPSAPDPSRNGVKVGDEIDPHDRPYRAEEFQSLQPETYRHARLRHLKGMGCIVLILIAFVIVGAATGLLHDL